MKNFIAVWGSTLAMLMALSAPAHAETIVLAVPGPGSLSYLPVYLAKAIEADHTEGLELKLRYFAGGPLAMRSLMSHNSDFMAIGLASLAVGRANGEPVVAIGQLSQSAMYALMLRSALKDQVHNIAQLKGRRIGITTGTNTQRSMGQMMMEYLLKRAGVMQEEVQFVSTIQNREGQRAALTNATVDAVMGDEPFASELVAQGIAVKLADLYQPKQSRDVLGGSIVHAALATRSDVFEQHPATMKKVQRMFDRTLLWLAHHSAQEIVDKLADQPGFDPANNKLLVDILQRNQGMFTEHTAWDAQAVTTTETFFHNMAASPQETKLSFTEFIRNVPGN